MAEVSIIVTAYNIEGYIEQCLNSVAAQTLSDIEVLVVDDGSTDSTPQKIVEFCDADPRFLPVLLQDNSPGGVATAANTGLDRATGPPEVIDYYGFKALTTWGDERDFRWFMPRLFELLVSYPAG